MSAIVETGAGLADANTYVDPEGAFAADYVAGSLYGSSWTAASSGNKEKAVRMATRVLDTGVDWYGLPTTDAQALAWPRQGVTGANGRLISETSLPFAIQRATMEMAIELLARDRTSDRAAGPETKKIGLGDGALEIEFTEGSDPASAKLPVISDAAWRYLRGLGSRVGSSGRMVKTGRG
jgi:hypothetical protein